MPRRTHSSHGSRSHSSRSRSRSGSGTRKTRTVAKGVKMPDHRIAAILKFEKEHEKIVFPDRTASQLERNHIHRKNTLEALRFKRGTSNWSKMTIFNTAYQYAINK